MLAKLSLDYHWPGYIRKDYQTWKLTTTVTTAGVSYLKPAPGKFLNVRWADIAHCYNYYGWIFPASIEYSNWCQKRWCNCSTCLNEPVVIVIEFLSNQLFRVVWKWTIDWHYFHIYASCNVFFFFTSLSNTVSAHPTTLHLCMLGFVSKLWAEW